MVHTLPPSGTDSEAATGADLIQTAEIARLAGVSPAAVGNWKARKPDFPPQMGSSGRRPLYRRDQVIEWLNRHGLLPSPAAEARSNAWTIAAQVVRQAPVSEATSLLLLLALGAKEAPTALASLAERRDLTTAECAAVLGHALDLPRWVTYDPTPLDPRTLRHLVQIFLKANVDELTAPAEPAIEEIYARGRAGRAGVPRQLAEFLVQLAAPRGTVYDPATSDGDVLAALVTSPDVAQGVDRVVGDEAAIFNASLALLRVRLAGTHPDLRVGNVPRQDTRLGLLADSIVTAPPMNLKLDVLDTADPRWRFANPRSDGDAAYLQHVVAHLAPHGLAVVLAPIAVTFRRGPVRETLAQLLRADLVDAVISLPAGALRSTGILTVALVLARDRLHSGTPGAPGPVLMVDASGLTVERRTGVIVGLEQVVTDYRRWAKDADWAPTTPTTSVAVRYHDIAAGDFVLDPRRHVEPSAVELDFERLRDERALLAQELRSASDNVVGPPGGPLLERSGAGQTIEMRSLTTLAVTEALTVARGVPRRRTSGRAGVAVVSPSELAKGSRPTRYASLADIADSGALVCQPGDVVVTLDGGNIGRAHLVRRPLDHAVVPSQGAATLRVIDPAVITPAYLYAWLSGPAFQEAVQRRTHGTTMRHLTWHDLMQLEIPVPALEEQAKIAIEVERHLDFIEAQQRILDHARDLFATDLEMLAADLSQRAATTPSDASRHEDAPHGG